MNSMGSSNGLIYLLRRSRRITCEDLSSEFNATSTIGSFTRIRGLNA